MNVGLQYRKKLKRTIRVLLIKFKTAQMQKLSFPGVKFANKMQF